MKEICPNCEDYADISVIKKTEEFMVRGESINVEVSFFQCMDCKEEFINPSDASCGLKEAYREYRQLHNIMQPEEILELRKRYGLTQSELCKILGWGGATLSRYENGALQDKAHEKTLSLIKEPHNLLKLIENNPNALTEKKGLHLISELKEAEKDTLSLERIFEENFGNYEPDKLSGYKKQDLEKFYNMILYFARGGIVKTVLNKLLFYSDFKHFKEYITSITGTRYARIQFGPVPDDYDFYYATLQRNKFIEVVEIQYSEDIIGEQFNALKKPDLTIFSNTELNVITSVAEYFKDFNASKISKFSHNEKGYQETPNSELISYEYASDLQI